MKTVRAFAGLPAYLCCLILGLGVGQAEDICGTISDTKTILEDSQLVGDVTCTVVNAPCIKFGAPDIRLRLNGFSITGRADPPDLCTNTVDFAPEDGIAGVGQDHVAILGPGLVQKFGRHGIFLANSTQVKVRRVTSHHNCFSGLLISSVTDSDIEENVSVRNALASAGSNGSPGFACGGTWIASSNNNRVRLNVYSGNGSALSTSPPLPPEVSSNFGVGLVGTSKDNLIEENSVGGNLNGIYVGPGTQGGNVIRRNIIAGNPPVQVSADYGGAVGADIQDLSPPFASTFEENLCVSYSGNAFPAPCPSFPKLILAPRDAEDDRREDAAGTSKGSATADGAAACERRP